MVSQGPALPRRRTLRDLRIRYKLLLSYSAVLLAATLVSNGVVYLMVRRTVRENIESQLATTTETIVTMVRVSAQLSVRNRLRAIAEKNREITEHYYRRARRGEITDDEARRLAQEVMLSQSIGDTGYLYVLSSRGVIVMHPKPALRGANLSAHGFIQDQLHRKTGYLEYDWKNPGEVDLRPKALYMTYFEPWDWIISASSYQDEFRQLVDVEDFRDRILSVRFGDTGYPYVIDVEGNVIIHPNLVGNVHDVVDSDGFPFVRTMCEERNGTIVYTWQNPGERSFRKKLALFTYLPRYDWIVVSSSYHDEFYAPLTRLRNVFVVTALLTLLLLVSLSFAISKTITRPMEHLIERLRRAAEGDFSVRVSSESRDEVGRLADYFNGFMSQLEEQQADRLRSQAEKEVYAERLRQSEKMEAIGQLAGGIAHDFNNMLAAVMGHAQLLGSEALTPRQRESVGQILLATSRATSLTRSLLDFSRKSATRVEEVDCHRLLSEVLNLATHSIDRRVRIVTDLRAETARLMGDPGRLQHAILNLILNARDAMPDGGEIRITTAVVEATELPTRATSAKEARYLRISVADEGDGMDAETLAHACEPFFTTKEPGKGTGLGLASVYGCVQAHEGDIRISSEPGAGTTVELFFALPSDALPSQPSRSPELSRGSGHVLVVEDEPTLRRFTAEALKELGYNTSTCSDGVEAVEYFAEHHAELSLVLLDLVMPGMGGREVFLRMREIDASVPVLFCSGFAERADMSGPIPDAAGFLQKPYLLVELARAVGGAMRSPTSSSAGDPRAGTARVGSGVAPR